jgi:uncharacterized protein (TIGR02996 family)
VTDADRARIRELVAAANGTRELRRLHPDQVLALVPRARRDGFARAAGGDEDPSTFAVAVRTPRGIVVTVTRGASPPEPDPDGLLIEAHRESPDAAHLLEAVLAAPGEDEPRLVYADRLLEAGDPRGELILTQCELERLDAWDERRAGLEARASALLEIHGEAWADGRAWKPVFRRGFVDEIECSASSFVEGASVFDAHPVRLVRVVKPVSDPAARRIAAAPHLARVRELALRCTIGRNGMSTILRSPHLRVRALDVAGHRGDLTPLLDHGLEELDISRGAMPPIRLLRSLRALRVLRARHLWLGGGDDLGAILALPLRWLDVSGSAVPPGSPIGTLSPTIEYLDAGALPGLGPILGGARLVELRATSDEEQFPAVARAADVDAIAAIPTLRRLSIATTGLGADDVARLARAPLEEIDLGGNIGVTGAAVAAIRTLRVVDLTGCQLGDEDVAALAELPGLEVLGLAFNSLGPTAARLVGDQGCFPRLRRVTLDEAAARELGPRFRHGGGNVYVRRSG